MADQTNQTNQERTSTVLDAKWRRSQGLDYATYAREKSYVSPSVVTSESLARLRDLKQKLSALSSSRRKTTLSAKH